MSRVIRRGADSGLQPLFESDEQPRFFDPDANAAIQLAHDQGFQEGRAEGYAAGKADAEASIARLESALEEALTAARGMRDQLVDDIIEAALAIAEHILGTAPAITADALADRLNDAFGQLDDPDLRLRVNPSDWAGIKPQVSVPHDVEVVEDPELAPGRALVQGRFARVDISAAAGLDVIDEEMAP